MTDERVPDDDWLVAGGGGDVADVAAHYDGWAESYLADLDRWGYQAPGRVARTVTVQRPQAGTLLDVGCGTGLVGQALRAAGCGAELTGLDISEASLEVAARHKASTPRCGPPTCSSRCRSTTTRSTWWCASGR